MMWENKTIASLGKVVTGKTPPKEQVEYWDGTELFVSPKDMERDSTYIYKTQASITPIALRKFKTQTLPRNAVMYTALSYGFGKIGIAPKKLLTNQQINSIIVNDENDFRFVYYLLRISTPYIFSYNSGIDTPIVPKSVFEKIRLLVPDLPIQQKIGDILFAYDVLIENNNRRIELLEKAAQELFKEWFVRMRFPGYRDTNFHHGIPDGWKMVKLGTLVQFKRGKTITEAETVKGDVPVVAGGLKPSCFHNIANTTAPVITVSASGANAGYTCLYYNNVWASDCSFLDSKSTNSIYYYYELIKNKQNIITNMQVGSAQPHVYPKDLNRLSVICPTENIIKIANKRLESFHKLKNVLTSKNENLIKQRELLLPRLMGRKLEI